MFKPAVGKSANVSFPRHFCFHLHFRTQPKPILGVFLVPLHFFRSLPARDFCLRPRAFALNPAPRLRGDVVLPAAEMPTRSFGYSVSQPPPKAPRGRLNDSGIRTSGGVFLLRSSWHEVCERMRCAKDNPGITHNETSIQLMRTSTNRLTETSNTSLTARSDYRFGAFVILAGFIALASGCTERRLQQTGYSSSSTNGLPFQGSSATNAVYAPLTPPANVVEAVPVVPGPEYVWVPGYWGWNPGWVWIGGRWVIRPHPGAVWVRGQWGRHGRGYVWTRGHWR
jgi:hypothetical protein